MLFAKTLLTIIYGMLHVIIMIYELLSHCIHVYSLCILTNVGGVKPESLGFNFFKFLFLVP